MFAIAGFMSLTVILSIVMFCMLFVGIPGDCGSGGGDCLPYLHVGRPPGAYTEHTGH